MSSELNSSVRISMTSLEEDQRPVYLTGSFNDWNPLDRRYEMVRQNDGTYTFDLEHTSSTEIAFKFTRGGWENVEIDRYGNITGNRLVDPMTKEVHEIVERWRVDWSPFKEEFFPIIELVSDEFVIPQLNKTRRIWALLPNDYKTSQKRYPVLYLHDAQNLFHGGSKYGNWEIDKKLSILSEYGRGDIIVIAIEHGKEDRAKEYLMGKNKVIKGVQGKKFIRFLADTLKPFIDKEYRTRPSRQFTGIGGSSLGGLLSIYAGFMYPEVYGKLMIFSPSLWAVANKSFPLLPFMEKFDMKIYLYAGDKESENLVDHVNEFAKQLENLDGREIQIQMIKRIRPGGTHNEFYWAQEFPRALEWLFYESAEDPLLVRSKNKKFSYDKSDSSY